MYDAIIVGSGIDTFMTAGLLTRAAGARVFVLEKHNTPGGLTHSFRRVSASWDVRLRHAGGMYPGSRLCQLFEYLTGGALTWNRMPSGCDRFVLPGRGLTATVSFSFEEYQYLLISLSPYEKRAIQRYCRDVKCAYSWMSLRYITDMVPPQAFPAIHLAFRLRTGYTLEHIGHYMERRFRNPTLRVLLITHWGDYGTEPTCNVFVVHAMIMCHCMDGAWFPRGGGRQIARTIKEWIRATGGEIRPYQDVDDVLIDNGRTVDVRVSDHSGPTPISYEERVPIVISGVGTREARTRLLPMTGPIGAFTACAHDKIVRLRYGGSAVTVYLILDHYPVGADGLNTWVNTPQGPDSLE